MNREKYKLGVIISTISLVDAVRKYAAKHDEDIQFAYKGLEEAVDPGREMAAKGVEVIMSRRGTAHLLRENLSIPVLSFLPHTSIDILISLKKAATYGKNVLFTTFRDKIYNLEIMEELLNIQITQGVYHDLGSMEEVIFTAGTKGCEVVVGGGLSVKFARKYGLQCVEIHTSEDVISFTIENAKSVAQAAREERERTESYRSIVDAASDGIIAVDRKAKIKTINKTAKDYLGIAEEDIKGDPVSRYIPEESIIDVLRKEKRIFNKIEKIHNRGFVFNHVPVMIDGEVIGSVSTFKKMSEVIRAENEVRRILTKGHVAKYVIEDFIHESASMGDLTRIAKRFARTDCTILIMGETGTGKEVLAHSIHNLSPRRSNPFVSTNCAALPEQLLESELFGYEEGAFTGSRKGGKAGLFEIAHKGSIFLDEIDSTPRNVQIRLLRILQERELRRVGGDRKIPINVRVISAASQDLGLAVQEGRFREDLFFRLNVLRIRIPPLRERTEDIQVLLEFFIRQVSKKYSLEPITLPESYIQELVTYTWPGNVRQLKNFTERLVLNCDLQCSLDILDELYHELIQYPNFLQSQTPKNNRVQLEKQATREKGRNENEIILKVLNEARFNKTQAAKSLGISRTTLWRKMKSAGLE